MDASSACSAPPCPSVSRFRRHRARDNRAAREADRQQRLEILDDVTESLEQGLPRSAALGCAAISSGTWRNWRRWQQAGRPRLAPRGRPPRCANQDERQKAIGFLVEYGSQVPLVALRQHVPTVPRAELADLRRRYQSVARWRRDRFRGRLFWKRVGAVWSMDFTEPKEYIGGTDRWILAIRDLTSGYQLAWLSFAQATAECVVQVLRALFIEHGPPLVLKSDNGSQFIAELTLRLLCEWRVEALFNPPRRPAYNGGLERTHPILKAYTLAAAAAQGRPAGVMREDLETGRTNANRFTRRLGDNGPTAEEAWRDREPISEEVRVAFRLSAEAHRPAARAARGYSDDAQLNHYQRAAVDRDALREALLAHDLLEIGPRRKRARRGKSPEQVPSQSSAQPVSTACCAGPAMPRSLPSESVVCLPARLGDAPQTVAAELAPPEPSALSPENRQTPFGKSLAPPPLAPKSCRIALAPLKLSTDDNSLSGAGPAHGEPVPPNTPRSFITPLINWLRRAKIR